MKVRETLERIAAFPMTHEFNDAQVRAMHQFMLGWRNYDELIKIAREAAGERPNKLIERAGQDGLGDDGGDEPGDRPRQGAPG